MCDERCEEATSHYWDCKCECGGRNHNRLEAEKINKRLLHKGDGSGFGMTFCSHLTRDICDCDA